MLDVEQLEQFEHEGYLVFERLLQGDDLVRARGMLDDLVDRGRKLEAPEPHFSLELTDEGEAIAGFLHKVQGVCVVEPRMLDVAALPAITDLAAQLLDSDEIDVFGTKFFPKLAAGGTSTHWHQDNFYFGTTSPRVLSCGIYYEDADLENGCLRVVPGSHHTGEIVEHQHTPGMHGSWTAVEEAKAVDLITPAGTVVLFSANLLHGTADNHSDRTRYSTAWHYIPADLPLERFPRGSYEDRFAVRPVGG